MSTTNESWVVHRRYRRFYDLHTQLEKRFLKETLPQIPAKKYRQHMDPAFIEQRRQELQDYLNELLSKGVPIAMSEEICAFLEVPPAFRIMMLEDEQMQEPAPSVHRPSDPSDSTGEKSMAWLLRVLQEAPNSKVSALQEFQDWVLTKPKFPYVFF